MKLSIKDKLITYLIDEAASSGKGANSAISFVHHYFENHRLDESHVQQQQ